MIHTFHQVSYYITRKDLQSRNSKTDEASGTCRRYIGTQYYVIFFAAQIHSKGVKLTPENSAIFQYCVITREL